MSDNTTNTETTETPAQGTDWKAEARKWEDRSKSNFDRLAVVEAERDKALAKVAEFEHSALRQRVSDTTGVPAHLIHGATEDALTEHAQQIAAAALALQREREPVAPVVKAQGKSPEMGPPDPALAAVEVLFSGDPNNLYPDLHA